MPDRQSLGQVQVLVPMAGPSAFFKPEDYPFPKPLIEVAGQPMIQRVIQNLRSLGQTARFIFVIREEDAARFSLDQTLRLLTGSCEIVSLRGQTQGALCSALMAIDHIDDGSPLVVCNGDQIIDADLQAILKNFETAAADAGVISFSSVHPRWSYVGLDEGGWVKQAAEKRVISRHAIAGFYYFRTARLFTQAAQRTIAAGSSVGGMFFIAPCLNELILDGGRVAAHRLEDERYHSFYSPAKIQEFEEMGDAAHMSRQSALAQVQVVIPAAGEGSRFRKAGYRVPKPFIELLGRPMIEHVVDNVAPKKATIHILLRSQHMNEAAGTVRELRTRGHHIHPVEALTEGTACTVLLARPCWDAAAPLLIANSDQLVDFSVDEFVGDCRMRGLDGSILVFRDPHRDPKWSFAQVDEQGLVIRVAEKQPISDLATVGIYFFTRAGDFVAAAADMIARNDRVNNEFYTCPVYNYMIAAGRRIGIFEVSAGAMHGLGTPDDFESFVASRVPEAS